MAVRSEAMVNAGRIGDVVQYCETDVFNTYRLWLIYELFRGTITAEQLAFTERQAADFIRARKPDNPHLMASLAARSLTNEEAKSH
jgi:3'-5' exonuclease